MQPEPPDPRGVGALRLAALGLTAAAMVATPLLRRGGRGRAVLADVVVGGLAAGALAGAAGRWGPRRAVAGFGAVTAATLVVEQLGSRTGVPFGRYAYTDRLRPQLAHVPVAVPLAWFGMAVPAREAAVALAPVARVPLGAALLTAWDLFLDPQMTGEGYWAWARPGAYRGIPLGNYAGWFLTGLGVMALLDATVPPDGEPDPVAVSTYAFMAVMSTLGFAVFFRDPRVALVGGAAMVPAAVAAVRRTRAGGNRCAGTERVSGVDTGSGAPVSGGGRG
jgi:putative membrane protein